MPEETLTDPKSDIETLLYEAMRESRVVSVGPLLSGTMAARLASTPGTVKEDAWYWFGNVDLKEGLEAPTPIPTVFSNYPAALELTRDEIEKGPLVHSDVKPANILTGSVAVTETFIPPGFSDYRAINAHVRAIRPAMSWEEVLEGPMSDQRNDHYEAELKKQREYFLDLIADIQKLRRAEFNAVVYGTMAVGVTIFLIGFFARVIG